MKNKNSINFKRKKYYFKWCSSLPKFEVFSREVLLSFFPFIFCYSHQFLKRIFSYLYHLFSNFINSDFPFKEQICLNALMCPVLHMARCTNVPTFESCPSLRSRAGFMKDNRK